MLSNNTEAISPAHPLLPPTLEGSMDVLQGTLCSRPGFLVCLSAAALGTPVCPYHLPLHLLLGVNIHEAGISGQGLVPQQGD